MDMIIDTSASFLNAINNSGKNNQALIQAEPSRFHLAQLSTQREPPKTFNTIKEIEIEKAKNWAIMDNIDVKNFKQMIPEPALTYPFELDEF